MPKPIRDATHQAVEVHNGFFPTVAITPLGKKIVFNGITYFYTGDACAANDLKLSIDGYQAIEGTDYILYSQNFSEIISFVFDMPE